MHNDKCTVMSVKSCTLTSVRINLMNLLCFYPFFIQEPCLSQTRISHFLG